MKMYEIVIATIMVGLNYLIYRNFVKQEKCCFKEAVILILVTMPIVLLSINMVSDTLTADELQYMDAIINLVHLDEPNVAAKLMLQYRTSQMLFGTIFNLIPRFIFENISYTNLIVLYKLLHWVVFYLIGMVIVYIVKMKYMRQSDSALKNLFAYIVCFFSVMGLPMTISIMKVCNYDASNVMFGTLGILLVGVDVLNETDEKGQYKYSKWGMFISVLGCLDKWSSAGYFMICLTLYVYSCMNRKRTNKIVVAFIETAKSILIALLIGYANLYYIGFILSDGNMESIKFGHIAFSFTNIFTIIFEGIEARVSENALFYIFLLYILVVIAAIMMYEAVNYLKGKKEYIKIFNKITVICICLFIGGGVISTYLIPQLLGAYAPVQAGELSVNTPWGEYHYGAYTYVGHKFSQIAYAFATVICNLPTSFLLLLIIYIFLMLKSRIDNIIYQCVILGSLVVICLFAYMDQPSDPRYFGVSILLMILSVLVAIYNQYIFALEADRMKKVFRVVVLPAILLCGFELILYAPNVKIFSPIWCIRTAEWKQSVRIGQWDAGEAMSWGEELALAGRQINKLIEKDGLSANEVTIYSDYGVQWLLNPGYTIKRMTEVDDTTRLNEKEYFVFTKKRLFRTNELPPSIYEIEPIATVKYKGEICSWIYNGLQLKKYGDAYGATGIQK